MITIGPFQLEHWHLGVIAVLLAFLAWFAWSFTIPISGTWERVDGDVRPGAVERVTFVQFGPFVKGRRMMQGGFQEFSGLLRGRSIALTRRDHGSELIIGQGFPEPLAPEIDGTVTAQMWLTLSADAQVLHGTFTPQRIEFTHHPPKITGRRFLDPSFRRYRLISRTPVETELVDPAQATPEAPLDEPRRIRRTV